jgi:hypothetical protein
MNGEADNNGGSLPKAATSYFGLARRLFGVGATAFRVVGNLVNPSQGEPNEECKVHSEECFY